MLNHISTNMGGACGLELGNVCVSSVALPKQHTSRICEGHEDLPSCKVVLEAIKF